MSPLDYARVFVTAYVPLALIVCALLAAMLFLLRRANWESVLPEHYDPPPTVIVVYPGHDLGVGELVSLDGQTTLIVTAVDHDSITVEPFVDGVAATDEHGRLRRVR